MIGTSDVGVTLNANGGGHINPPYVSAHFSASVKACFYLCISASAEVNFMHFPGYTSLSGKVCVDMFFFDACIGFSVINGNFSIGDLGPRFMEYQNGTAPRIFTPGMGYIELTKDSKLALRSDPDADLTLFAMYTNYDLVDRAGYAGLRPLTAMTIGDTRATTTDVNLNGGDGEVMIIFVNSTTLGIAPDVEITGPTGEVFNEGNTPVLDPDGAP